MRYQMTRKQWVMGDDFTILATAVVIDLVNDDARRD